MGPRCQLTRGNNVDLTTNWVLKQGCPLHQPHVPHWLDFPTISMAGNSHELPYVSVLYPSLMRLEKVLLPDFYSKKELIATVK